MKKKSKKFKRNKIKLIKLKNRKKKIWNSENLERNLKKNWEVFDKLVQNYSKVNFGTVFKNNEILRKILQNCGKHLQNFEKLSMIFYKKTWKYF